MQIADITLNNGAATPVAKTFEVGFKDGLTASWKLHEGARPALYPVLAVNMRKPRKGNSNKVKQTVDLPYDVTDVNGVVTTKSVTIHVAAVIPEDAPEATIADAIAFSSGAQVVDMIEEICLHQSFPY